MNELNISEGAPQDKSLSSSRVDPKQEFFQILQNGSKFQVVTFLFHLIFLMLTFFQFFQDLSSLFWRVF